MSSRFALIIESSNVSGEKDLPGARADAKNWKSFLMSNLGGAWNEDEIIVREKPEAEWVRRIIRNHADGYMFLVFSGHGQMVLDRTTWTYKSCVCLNNKERDVGIDSIMPQHKGTAVFDCCRGMPQSGAFAKCGRVLNESFALDGLSNESVALNAMKSYIRARCRHGFERGIDSLDSFRAVKMFACSEGEGAGEDPSAGGFYTSLLIGSARDWECADQKRGGILIPGVNVLSTYEAHEIACIGVMAKTKGGQVPKYSPSGQAYPFAIRV